MALRSDVESDIEKTVRKKLVISSRNDGNIETVPDPAKMGYSDGIYLPSTYLYADMANSSGLVATSPPPTVASILKAYLSVSTRIIRANNGFIRSFDGDRVMGIYAGPDRHNRAVLSAMQIKWALKVLVQPAITERFSSLKKSGWQVNHGCGIASGQALLVRAGFRGNDDMISIGATPNLAAKLSDERQGKYSTLVDEKTFSELSQNRRYSKGVDMWEGPFTYSMGGEKYLYYKTPYRTSFY